MVVRKWGQEQPVRIVEEGIVLVGTVERMGREHIVVVVEGGQRSFVREVGCIAVEEVAQLVVGQRKDHMAFWQEDHVDRIDRIQEQGVYTTF